MENCDYSLLRPFDLEAAKRGHQLCCPVPGMPITTRNFIVGPDARGWICIQYPGGNFDVCNPDQYRMAPLAWVKGKPVYEGDKLFGPSGWAVATKKGAEYESDGCVISWLLFNPELWSWQHPKQKTKHKVNMFAYCDGNALMWRREGVPLPAHWKRVPSEDKAIEVDE